MPKIRPPKIAESGLSHATTSDGQPIVSHDWPTTAGQARALQLLLRPCVNTTSDLTRARYIAGIDIGFQDQGQITRAAAVVIDPATGHIIESAVVRQATRMPYIPGFLSFREVPAGLAALADLSTRPDLVMVDGHGIAHPRRVGVATHLGLVSGLPTIGVAKKRLTGEHAPVGDARLATCPLMDHDEQIGSVLRSRVGVKPIFISPGHRVNHDDAVAWVASMLSRYKLPEPTRQADKLASRRR